MKRYLIFFRLVDANDGLISLTNIALMVVVAKLCFVKTATIADLGMLLMALANYNAKKYLGTGNPTDPSILPTALKSLGVSV